MSCCVLNTYYMWYCILNKSQLASLPIAHEKEDLVF